MTRAYIRCSSPSCGPQLGPVDDEDLAEAIADAHVEETGHDVDVIPADDVEFSRASEL